MCSRKVKIVHVSWAQQAVQHVESNHASHLEEGEDQPVGQPLGIILGSRRLDSLEGCVHREQEPNEVTDRKEKQDGQDDLFGRSELKRSTHITKVPPLYKEYRRIGVAIAMAMTMNALSIFRLSAAFERGSSIAGYFESTPFTFSFTVSIGDLLAILRDCVVVE